MDAMRCAWSWALPRPRLRLGVLQEAIRDAATEEKGFLLSPKLQDQSACHVIPRRDGTEEGSSVT